MAHFFLFFFFPFLFLSLSRLLADCLNFALPSLRQEPGCRGVMQEVQGLVTPGAQLLPKEEEYAALQGKWSMHFLAPVLLSFAKNQKKRPKVSGIGPPIAGYGGGGRQSQGFSQPEQGIDWFSSTPWLLVAPWHFVVGRAGGAGYNN